MKPKTVAVLGGGVAGMSAAHELIKRGYDVTVYERNKVYCGGKARSVNVPGTNTQKEDKYLPGEHGFRFFPGFYQHITETMKEIPYPGNRRGVFDNLTSTTEILLARNNANNILTVANFPNSISSLKLIIHDLFGGLDTGLTKAEEELFASKLWQLMTSSITRRNNDYERLAWWDFLEADGASKAYISLLVEGLTRTLVAAQAKTASTKTGGDIFLQLIFNMMTPGVNTDRVLNGPTNDRWLTPWLKYLKESGVTYHFGHKVESLTMKDKKIESAIVLNEKDELIKVEADYFILATPVEGAAPLMNKDILKADPRLDGITTLAADTSWMNGIQYYLDVDVPLAHGHTIYSDSQWAVTSISQIQFWKDYDLSDRYNGKVKGILSVDVSDWLTTEYKGKLAEECEPDDVAKMVWEQIENGINKEGEPKVLDWSMVVHYYVDRDIRWNRIQDQDVDKEPLLVNKVETWDLRPEAYCSIPNLFFASDYVRTNTDLATMEGANEAAKRAVNALMEQDGSKAQECGVYQLKEPWFFYPLKWWDKKRYNKGLPYTSHVPWWLKVFMLFWGGAYLVMSFFRAILFEIYSFIKSIF